MDQRAPGLVEGGASGADGRASDQKAAPTATPRDEGLLTGWEQIQADVLGSRRSV